MDPKLSHSIAKFALKFCNELDKDRTTICSPLSAEIVLALLALGCKDQAHAELLRALDIPDDEALRSSFAFVTSTLKTMESVTLKMANKVYVAKNRQLKPEILKDAEETFDASLVQLDFEENKAAADIVNKWVADKTSNKIKDIVSSDMFNSDTRLVLVNAIYFQALWSTPFRTVNTKNRDFHVNNTTKIQVSQMFKDRVDCGYRESPELKAKLLEIFYKNHEASMVIVLPDEIEGLSFALDQLMGGHDIMEDIASMKNRTVTVQIPKFKIEMSIDLKKLLPMLGINSIFDKDTSDIDMLTSNEKLCVTEAIQKAYIEVDEMGTVAAAATTGFVYKAMCRRRYKQFIADRPFLYMLTARKIPLFIGIYRGVATTE